VYSVTDPLAWTRTVADSQPPPCRPNALGPTARDGALPQISVYVLKPMPR
jgi:hypothetical protein